MNPESLTLLAVVKSNFDTLVWQGMMNRSSEQVQPQEYDSICDHDLLTLADATRQGHTPFQSMTPDW
jgi:hypothetical protein